MQVDLVFQQCDEKLEGFARVESAGRDGSRPDRMVGLSTSIGRPLDCVEELDKHCGLRIGLSILGFQSSIF